MFILDTNVISAAHRPQRNATVATWLKAQREDDLYLSVITIGEIARGISQQERVNAAFAADLTEWLQKTETLFQDRILPFSSTNARIWGELSAKLGHSGADLMIAATALSFGATVVTRNVADFQPTGVHVLDPFSSGP